MSATSIHREDVMTKLNFDKLTDDLLKSRVESALDMIVKISSEMLAHLRYGATTSEKLIQAGYEIAGYTRTIISQGLALTVRHYPTDTGALVSAQKLYETLMGEMQKELSSLNLQTVPQQQNDGMVNAEDIAHSEGDKGKQTDPPKPLKRPLRK